MSPPRQISVRSMTSSSGCNGAKVSFPNLMAKAPLEDYRKQLLLVSSNADRKEYNEIIRNEYRCKGEIEDGWDFWITAYNGEKDAEEKRRFAPRDRIIFTSNDKRLGVLNGTMGQIEAIKGNIFTVRTDSGEQVTFDIGQYNSIDYSYAVTNYKAQGMGVELAVADMPTSGRGQTRNAAYVDLSRASREPSCSRTARSDWRSRPGLSSRRCPPKTLPSESRGW